MAFLNTDFGSKYIDDFYYDKIPNGLGIGIEIVDNHVSFKQGQYNIVIGVDNVGKTDFLLWYFLILALKYDKKIDIWKALDSDNCEIYGDNLKWMWLDASLNKSDSILFVAENRLFPF